MKKMFTVIVLRPGPLRPGDAKTYIAHVNAVTPDNAMTQARLDAIRAAQVAAPKKAAAAVATDPKKWEVLAIFSGHHSVVYQA